MSAGVGLQHDLGAWPEDYELVLSEISCLTGNFDLPGDDEHGALDMLDGHLQSAAGLEYSIDIHEIGKYRYRRPPTETIACDHRQGSAVGFKTGQGPFGMIGEAGIHFFQGLGKS